MSEIREESAMTTSQLADLIMIKMHEDSGDRLADRMMEIALSESYFDELPPDEELKTRLPRKDRIEWTDCKIKILALSNQFAF